MESNNEESKSHFETKQAITTPDGWLSPGGIYLECGPSDHDLSAEYIWEKILRG